MVSRQALGAPLAGAPLVTHPPHLKPPCRSLHRCRSHGPLGPQGQASRSERWARRTRAANSRQAAWSRSAPSS
eukprot:3412428-Prymnesium_polylepis.1